MDVMNAKSCELPARPGCRLAVGLGFLALLLAGNARLSNCFAQGTAFTYQGRLNDGGSQASGNYDMEFYLRTAASAGSPVGATNFLAPVPVTNGLLTVVVDFGSGIFTGLPLWL